MAMMMAPNLILGECTCDSEAEERDKNLALKYKVSILVTSAIGVCIPFLGKIIPALNPEKNLFFLVKAFAAGVILASGFIHVLPDAFENLTTPCLDKNPWEKFPFTGFIAMVAAIGTLMIHSYATCFHSKSYLSNKAQNTVAVSDVEDSGTHVHGHVHGYLVSEPSQQLIRQCVVSQVLEPGIVVHSVIIGTQHISKGKL
nr:PREDICTED: zinc transporter 1-like [Daucus carota subsp. sativus]